MANLKRRPDKELNHDNWEQEDAPEEKGEFKKANEDELKGRKMLKPRRKLTTGAPSASGPSNPFGAFAFGAGGSGGVPAAVPGFGFGIPNALIATGGLGGSDGVGSSGGSGSLFKLAGITPSSEPPTRASADSSTADTPGATAAAVGGGQKQDEAEPEVGSISESEGITEESSNSSSLPWNVSSRQQEKEAGADSMQSQKRSDNGDLDEEESVEKASSAEAMQSRKVLTTERKVAQTSTGPADSSGSSSASNPNLSTTAPKNPFSSFSFGSSFAGGSAGGSLFQPFASASAAVSQSQNAAAATAAAASASAATSSTPTQQTSQLVSGGGDPRSPESSGILVRSSLEDSADYENDTTSSSNNLLNSNEVSNDYQDGVGGAGDDREAEADCDSVNEDREAEGVDS